MKTLKVNTSRELKSMNLNIKSINGINVNSTGFDITNKYVSYYSVEKQNMVIINEPFNIELKN